MRELIVHYGPASAAVGIWAAAVALAVRMLHPPTAPRYALPRVIRRRRGGGRR